MTNSQENARRWVVWMTRQRKLVSYILIILALPLAGLAIWWGVLAYRETAFVRWDLWAITFWASVTAMIALGGGLWQLLDEPSPATEQDATGLLVLSLGGLIGFVTFLGSLMLAWAWWDAIASWLLDPGQVKEWWKGLVVALALVGNLGLMFACLQGARTEERTNPTLRRLIYGYNTALTGLLLLSILAVANALLYLKFPKSIDFTTSNIYSLSSRSKNMLQSLEQPLTIISIMPNDLVNDSVKTLLINFRETNPRIETEEVDVDLNLNRIDELQKKYPLIGRAGLLVVYGTESRFIDYNDLFTRDMRGPRGDAEKQSFKFKGEDALMTQIDALTSDKMKPVIYFTQGNGEMDINDMATKPGLDRGMGMFRERLTKRNYECRALTITPADNKWMDDAKVVVIAGPTLPFPDHALKALREFLSPSAPNKPKGKLLILLDPPKAKDRFTGLEAFLREQNVQVDNERIFTLPMRGNVNQGDVRLVFVQAKPESTNPVAKAFEGEAFGLYNVRPVQAAAAMGRSPMENRFTAQELLLAPTMQLLIVDNKLKQEPREFFEELQNNRELINQMISKKPVPVAVAVTEGEPFNPHAGMRPPSEQKPCMVVVGCASMAANVFMSERGGRGNFEFLASSLDWLRGREGSIGIEPKSRETFVLGPSFSGGRLWRMVLFSTFLLFFTIVGVGIGVWVVRRR